MDYRIFSFLPQITSDVSLFEKKPIKSIEPMLNSKPVQVITLPEDEEEFFDVDEIEDEEFFDCEEIVEDPSLLLI
jgi:hypothetical protein